MEVRWAVATIRRQPLVVALPSLLLAVLAAVLTYSTVPVYTAAARGVVSVAEPSSRSANVLTSGSQYILARLTSYAELATTTQVLDPVAATFGLPQGGPALARSVSAQNEVHTAFIDVSASDEQPQRAAAVADAVLARLAATVDDLENGNVRLVSTGPVAVPTAPSNKGVTVNVVLGALGGLVLGVALAVLAQFARDRRGTGQSQPQSLPAAEGEQDPLTPPQPAATGPASQG